MFGLIISNFDDDNYSTSKRLVVKSNNKESKARLKKWAKDLKSHLTKEGIHMANKGHQENKN